MCEFKVLMFCVFIYLIQLPTGNGLRCGVCTSEMKPECADASKVTTFKTCDANKESVCRTVEHYNSKENRIHFSRACIDGKDVNNVDACSPARLAYFGRVMSCKTCNTDYCNANPNLDVKKIKVEEKYAVPQTNEKKETSFSTVLRSSFRIVITFMILNLYRMCIL